MTSIYFTSTIMLFYENYIKWKVITNLEFLKNFIAAFFCEVTMSEIISNSL